MCVALLTLLWFPIGTILAILRIFVGVILPISCLAIVYKFLGVGVIVHGNPPVMTHNHDDRKGVMYVCTHRTLLDPVMVGVALRRPVTAVTYSISRLSELLSPIRTVPLTRNREKDATNIKGLLQEGDLALCPEGTTCREPYLLRFSALFAELSNHIVPVAMNAKMSMFHGTTARGRKSLDPFYFFMNPRPIYEVGVFFIALQKCKLKHIDFYVFVSMCNLNRHHTSSHVHLIHHIPTHVNSC